MDPCSGELGHQLVDQVRQAERGVEVANPRGSAYPRTVEGWQSTTTIPERPERIVVLTGNELRALLSLGVAPTQINCVTEDLEWPTA